MSYNRKHMQLGAATALMMGVLNTPSAAVDQFIKIGDIQGEEGAIVSEVLTWTWGTSPKRVVDTGNKVDQSQNRNSVCTKEFIYIKEVDQNSPRLLLKSMFEETIPEAVLHVEDTGDTPSGLTIKMKDVVISSTSIGGVTDGKKISEKIHLKFRQAEFKYVSYSTDGIPTETVENYDITSFCK